MAKVDGENIISLSWLKPKKCDGAVVAGYYLIEQLVVKEEEPSSREWKKVGTTRDLWLKVSTLPEERQIYCFRIFAVNFFAKSQAASCWAFTGKIGRADGKYALREKIAHAHLHDSMSRHYVKTFYFAIIFAILF